ncbi:mitochondrial folate transporter/carrier [Plakobranchus ocellatus]|uniref:Solute carrier family 25 member 32 n=1 Tax=Plakobranchus ocellatus TaxID=259542 RepID=A0AAV3YWZ9_9GAST|nr:mitochondrial folate transporter/carrier [Plakobranchus ocellatus]
MESSNKRVTSGMGSLMTHIKLEHMAAGVTGGVVSSLALHPLDLLKVRFQGVTGGVVSSLALHPLDLLKVRFQVDEGPNHKHSARPQYRGIIHAFRTIVESDGWKGLYRGVTPNVTGAGVSWGLYFLFYNTTKTYMQDGDTTINLGPGKHMFIASLAGLATLTIANPIWVSKTRMCLQYGTGSPANAQFVGMWETLYGVYRLEGVRGLYRGFLPGVFGISHGALQFMAYEELKTLYNRHRNQPIDTRLTSLEYLTFAALSKMFAAATTYPYQVVRSRLQEQHRNYNGVWDCIKQIWVFEGLYGYYKGLIPNLLRVTPACAITFIVYESIITALTPPKDKPPAIKSSASAQ